MGGSFVRPGWMNLQVRDTMNQKPADDSVEDVNGEENLKDKEKKLDIEEQAMLIAELQIQLEEMILELVRKNEESQTFQGMTGGLERSIEKPFRGLRGKRHA